MAEDACPCFSDWASHEDYLTCVEEAVEDFSKKIRVKIRNKAERSDCGKSAQEVCPCSSQWKNHKQYVTCITKAVQGLAQDEQDPLITQAEMSDCGMSIEEICPCHSGWEGHEEYISCMKEAVKGLDKKKRVKVLSKAQKSNCGAHKTTTKSTPSRSKSSRSKSTSTSTYDRLFLQHSTIESFNENRAEAKEWYYNNMWNQTLIYASEFIQEDSVNYDEAFEGFMKYFYGDGNFSDVINFDILEAAFEERITPTQRRALASSSLVERNLGITIDFNRECLDKIVDTFGAILAYFLHYGVFLAISA